MPKKQEVIDKEFYKNKILEEFVRLLTHPSLLDQAVYDTQFVRVNEKAIYLSDAITKQGAKYTVNPNIAFDARLKEHQVYKKEKWSDANLLAIHSAASCAVAHVKRNYPYIDFSRSDDDNYMKAIAPLSKWFDIDVHKILVDYVKSHLPKNFTMDHFEDLPDPANLQRLSVTYNNEAIQYNSTSVERDDQKATVEKLRHVVLPYYHEIVQKSAKEFQKILASVGMNESLDKLQPLIIERFSKLDSQSNTIKEMLATNKMQALYDQFKALQPMQEALESKKANNEKLHDFALQLSSGAKQTLSKSTSSSWRNLLKTAAYIVANVIPGLGFLVSAIKNGTPAFWKTKGAQVTDRINETMKKNESVAENLDGSQKSKKFSVVRMFHKAVKPFKRKEKPDQSQHKSIKPGNGGA